MLFQTSKHINFVVFLHSWNHIRDEIGLPGWYIYYGSPLRNYPNQSTPKTNLEVFMATLYRNAIIYVSWVHSMECTLGANVTHPWVVIHSRFGRPSPACCSCTWEERGSWSTRSRRSAIIQYHIRMHMYAEVDVRKVHSLTNFLCT